MAFQSEGLIDETDVGRRLFQAGEIRGHARALLAVLDARCVDVPDRVRADIESCTDLARFKTWLYVAALAHRIEELGI